MNRAVRRLSRIPDVHLAVDVAACLLVVAGFAVSVGAMMAAGVTLLFVSWPFHAANFWQRRRPP